jgi:hypothetical protein
MRSIRSLLLAAAGAAAFAPAAALADWQPQVLSRGPAVGPILAFDGRGGGGAAWEDRRFERHKQHVVLVAPHSPGGRFAREHPVGRGLLVSGLTLDSHGRWLLLVTRHGRRSEHFEILVGSPSRGFHVAQVLERARRRYPAPPLLAGDARGDAIAVWGRRNGARRSPVIFSSRVRGGRFSRPRAISEAGVSGLSAAMGAEGDYAITWVRRGRVEARLGHGQRLGPALVLSPVHSDVTVRAPVAGDDSGDAIVAWVGGTQTIDIDFAYRPAGGDFEPPRTASASPVSTGVGLGVAFGAPGRAALAWDGGDTSGPGVFGEEVDAGTPLGQERLSPAGGPFQNVSGSSFKALAAAPDGRAAVAWTQPSTSGPTSVNGGTLFVSERAVDGTFGGPEPVATLTGIGFDVALGFEPVGGSPFVLLAQRRLGNAGVLQSYTRR